MNMQAVMLRTLQSGGGASVRPLPIPIVMQILTNLNPYKT
jgi:hypothetical protein